MFSPSDTAQRERRESLGHDAVLAGTPDYAMNDATTNAVDTIANVLLWLDSLGPSGNPSGALERARDHFEIERR